uniref:Syncoilin, intermediate filament protein n=2 Tax=Nothobranchius korthausae TaxID=1143690 RepID=A0A1A8FVL4_9TELE
MENKEEDVSSTGFQTLFIREDKGDSDEINVEQKERKEPPSGLPERQFKQSSLVTPYLQEMDDLLRSCEELTDVPFGSCHSAGYRETRLSSSQVREEVRVKRYQETCTAPQAYLSTSYIDTNMEDAERETAPGQGFGDLMDRCQVYQQTEMPLSSAGTKLSAAMVEYEGQLLGMLAMHESCMEEASMDFELQDQAADLGQEYVHISKSPHRYQGTALVPVKQESLPELESLQVQSKLCVDGSKARKNEGTQKRPHTDPGDMFKERTGMNGDGTELDVDEEIPELWADLKTLGALGSQMEDCIEEVQLLQRRRKDLLVEVLQLRGHKEQEDEKGRSQDMEETEQWIDSKITELMNVFKKEEEVRREERKREVCNLRKERAEEERKLWKANLERQGVQEELRRLKRRLFAVARDGGFSQAAGNHHRREVEVLKREEEKLNSLVLQLTEESLQLRSAHGKQLLDARAQLHATTSSQTSNTQEELMECRRNSCGDIQQYLQSGLKALEDRYEPMLLVLLKRRETTAAALTKAREQGQELRGQLGPLREQIQKLKLEKVCCEEKIKLVTVRRWEDVGRYKEAVFYLEEQSRELKTELNIQRRKTKEMEMMRENLTKQLLLHRAATKSHNIINQEEKT